jgi:hypothetical protein
LGFGVTSFIVGDIDGRLKGAFSIPMNLFTNASNNLIQDGIPQSAFITRLESVVGLIRAGTNSYEFPNQHPIIAPDVLMNFDIESDLWLNVGTVTPYPKNPIDGGLDPLVLPLSTGKTQPDYTDNTTWRDRSLEACIMTAVGDCFSNRSARAVKIAKRIGRKKPIVKREAKDNVEVEQMQQLVKERFEQRIR